MFTFTWEENTWDCYSQPINGLYIYIPRITGTGINFIFYRDTEDDDGFYYSKKSYNTVEEAKEAAMFKMRRILNILAEPDL